MNTITDTDNESSMYVRLDGGNFTVVKSRKHFYKGRFRARTETREFVRVDEVGFTVSGSQKAFEAPRRPARTPIVERVDIADWLRIFEENRIAENAIRELRMAKLEKARGWTPQPRTVTTPCISELDMGEWLRVTEEAREVDNHIIECRITRMEQQGMTA